MSRVPDSHEVKIDVDGRLAAVAQVSPTDDPTVVRSAMHIESGQLPPGTRSALVDAVLDDPQVSGASHLSASMPAGDSELLDRIKERTDSVESRRAGATNMVEADLRPQP